MNRRLQGRTEHNGRWRCCHTMHLPLSLRKGYLKATVTLFIPVLRTCGQFEVLETSLIKFLPLNVRS